jgi:hypothetical protein
LKTTVSSFNKVIFFPFHFLLKNALEVANKAESDYDELEALAEIVPGIKSKATKERENHTMTVDLNDHVATQIVMSNGADENPIEVSPADLDRKLTVQEKTFETNENVSHYFSPLETVDSMIMHSGSNADEEFKRLVHPEAMPTLPEGSEDENQKIKKLGEEHVVAFDTSSDGALHSESGVDHNTDDKATRKPDETYPNISSGNSLSTATQTHEVRKPLFLATFKPATGCTNASDFIVRCFVARLRSGITVVKHGRSRWCKSRLRILHIHPDGRSLSWKPAVGEPTSSKRPPKLDLSTCEEVRHAWSPDPLNPMFTGTSILRQKCEAANAHKSFALIFPKRTVDITAVTADQCKVLLEGFSALCFRLQVANLAGRGSKKNKTDNEEEAAPSTASATLTNNSATLSPSLTSRAATKKT